MEEYSDEQLRNRISATEVGTIWHDRSLAPRKGSWRWTGYIIPAFSETYTFLLDTDNYERPRLWLEDQLVIEGEGRLRGSIDLEAGKPYWLTLTYSTPYQDPHTAILYWASDSQPRETVAPAGTGEQKISRLAGAGEQVKAVLPGMRKGDGFSLEFVSRGLSVRYPQWNYDVRGVIWK